MQELILALAIVLVVEGALYALFPTAMKRMMATVQQMPDSSLRTAGMVFAFLGTLLVWFLHG
ncbi:MAG TPA: DUF2065 domain-containing protein [Alphaproteobacteria bacterium]|nr:DUF2065 domain-containing protein [Alphaproteobacteria bacterium]HCO91945.1 DUF2065 domain-containing protein [Alphaproteobacteria bacterium]